MNTKTLPHIAAKSLGLLALPFALALSFTLAGSHPAIAGDDSGSLRGQAHPPGNLYSAYQAKWWQWATSLPADHNPLLDTADGSAGQAGPVWYLGGVFGSAPAERTLTVPAGKSLFFPVINLAYFLTDATDTVEGSRELINLIMDYIVHDETFVEIDGQSVADLERYRTDSPLFDVGPLPENNLLGVDAGTVIPTVDDGIYLLLSPLTPGEHTIRFGGRVFVPAGVLGEDPWENIQDVTYHITVEPRRK